MVRGTENDSKGDLGGDGAGPGRHCDMCSIEIIIPTMVLGIYTVTILFANRTGRILLFRLVALSISMIKKNIMQK